MIWFHAKGWPSCPKGGAMTFHRHQRQGLAFLHQGAAMGFHRHQRQGLAFLAPGRGHGLSIGTSAKGWPSGAGVSTYTSTSQSHTKNACFVYGAKRRFHPLDFAAYSGSISTGFQYGAAPGRTLPIPLSVASFCPVLHPAMPRCVLTRLNAIAP